MKSERYQQKISGRLGNQMFQYAAMLGIGVRLGIDAPMEISFEDVYKEAGREVDLDKLNTRYAEINHVKLSLMQRVVFYAVRVEEKIAEFFSGGSETKLDTKKARIEQRWMSAMAKTGVLYYSRGYFDFSKVKKINKRRIYLVGYFETSKYFNDIRPMILDAFTPRKAPLKKNAEFYDVIERTESVCVSVRRGDFLSDKFKKVHYVCKPKYFEEAVDIMTKKLGKPRFFVFSDDIDWCRKNISFPSGTIFEDGSDPVWEKLRLMYSCKHFIISNSTFSWWAQYLSRNKNKVVIAPKKWKNDGVFDDIYDEGWVVI